MKLKAIVYDFDGTLTPEAQAHFAILEKSGYAEGMTDPKFLEKWRKCMSQGLDAYAAAILTVNSCVKEAGFKLIDENIGLGAKERNYNPGVEEFIRFLREKGVANYLLSSGSQAYLKQTTIASLFTEIFASTLRYDENGEAIDIELVMSDEQKAETLKQIANEVNGTEEDCEGIVYIGDGPTDLPVFKFIKGHGGKSVLVCRDLENTELKELGEQAEIDRIVAADYREGGELYNYITELV